MDGQPERYAKGLKPRPPTMQGILGNQTPTGTKEFKPSKPMDLEDRREISNKRSKIRELSNTNREMRSSKIHTNTLENFTDKKSNARLAKYLTDRDDLAALAL